MSLLAAKLRVNLLDNEVGICHDCHGPWFFWGHLQVICLRSNMSKKISNHQKGSVTSIIWGGPQTVDVTHFDNMRIFQVRGCHFFGRENSEGFHVGGFNIPMAGRVPRAISTNRKANTPIVLSCFFFLWPRWWTSSWYVDVWEMPEKWEQMSFFSSLTGWNFVQLSLADEFEETILCWGWWKLKLWFGGYFRWSLIYFGRSWMVHVRMVLPCTSFVSKLISWKYLSSVSLKAGKEQRLPGPFSDELVRGGPLMWQINVFSVGPDLQETQCLYVCCFTFEKEQLLGKAFNKLSWTSSCVNHCWWKPRETHLKTCRFVKAGNSLAG